MIGTNTNTFPHGSYYPARVYAAAFSSPTDGDTTINTLLTGSFFQADQHQNTDQTNSDSSVYAIAIYSVKLLTDAYLAITRLWQLGGFYPVSLVPTRQRFRKAPKLITDCTKYLTKTTTSKRRNNE